MAPERDTSPITADTDTEKHLTVTVRIDGNGPYRFVVDTGADRTVLATDIAAELGLVFRENVMLEGVVRAVKAQTVTIRELSFGVIRYQSLVVPTLPRSTLGADGYLGLDTLDGHRVTFDFKNHTLQVGAPHSRLSALLVRDNEARIRTVGSSGHLRALNCLVDGVRAAAFIDSGADLSAGNQALFDALASRNPAYGDIGRISLVDVTGGETSGSVTLVKKIQIMELELTDCPLVIADFKVFDVWGLTRAPGASDRNEFFTAVLKGVDRLRTEGTSLRSGQLDRSRTRLNCGPAQCLALLQFLGDCVGSIAGHYPAC